MPKTSVTINLSEASKLAEQMAKKLRGGEILALSGPLGSGKTTFTKALGKALGIRQNIPSPTFVMMQEFETTKNSTDKNKKLILYHLDLYRTKSFAEVKSLGITEWWGHPQTITVIEWADKINAQLPPQTIRLIFQRDIHDN
jgi:tRNA threonylcarbamoyladenosine biosynthesis protein TsaE